MCTYIGYSRMLKSNTLYLTIVWIAIAITYKRQDLWCHLHFTNPAIDRCTITLYPVQLWTIACIFCSACLDLENGISFLFISSAFVLLLPIVLDKHDISFAIFAELFFHMYVPISGIWIYGMLLVTYHTQYAVELFAQSFVQLRTLTAC